jgi:hypothetical protein
MKGLILAGLGKGIADASSTFGTMMMRQNEEDRRDAREEAREARKLQAAEAREEQAKQRMIQEIATAREGGEQINRERVAGQVLSQGGANIAGDSPAMDPAEFANILRDNPEYEQVYRQAGLIKDGMDPRAQRATDQYEAALSAGASSATLQGLEKAKSNVLALIREERAEKRDDESARRFDVSEERRSAADAERFRISQQNANTSATRAENAAQGRAATQERMTTIVNSQTQVLRELGSTPPRIRGATPEEQEAANKDWEASRNKARALIKLAQDRMTEALGETSPQGGNSDDNTGSSNPGMPRPQSREELNQLPSGTRYIAPDGTVRTKS